MPPEQLYFNIDWLASLPTAKYGVSKGAPGRVKKQQAALAACC
jgi:hypothetical protein